MLEHTFLLAWARQCGLERGVPDMKELSAQLLNKGGRIALLRSQAIAKPKSGHDKAEPVSRTVSRINVNIDNIAEAAVERLRRLSPLSIRRLLESAGQADSSGPSDADGDRPPARKPRAAEPPHPPLGFILEKENLILEKENFAPPRQQRDTSSSQRTDLESSIAKQTVSASRSHSLPQQPQRRSDERNTFSNTASPCLPAKVKSEVVSTETAVPTDAVPCPPRGLSSKSENKTRTASAPPAEVSCREPTHQVGRKRNARERVENDVDRTKSTAEEKMMYRRKSQARTEDDARLVPATGERSSQHFVDKATPTDAGKLTTARLDGALDNTLATADGQPLCVSQPCSRNSSVGKQSFVVEG